MKKLIYICLLLGNILCFWGCNNRRVLECTPKEYYEILGINISGVQSYNPQSQAVVFSPQDPTHENANIIPQGEFPQFMMNFNTSFFSVSQSEKPQTPKNQWDIQFFPSAYALVTIGDPCASQNGSKGTPDRIRSFTITSDSDFDATHPAGSSLNEYFQIGITFNNFTQPLEEWLQNAIYNHAYASPFFGSLYMQTFDLRLLSAPYPKKVHALSVKIMFEDGRTDIKALPKIYIP